MKSVTLADTRIHVDATQAAKERPKLLSIIQRRLRDRVESEDVAQDVFVELLQADDVGYAIERLGAWLVRVAQNKVLDRIRRRKTQETHSAEAERMEAARQDEVPQPDGEWSRARLREEIVEALSLLPPDQREVFVMHELEGKSFEEIAQATGVKLNTLLARKRSAVLSLREQLKEVYDELD